MPLERILIVDDEAAVRGIMSALLERSGYHVFTVASGEQAIAILQQDQGFDLIMSDIMMPGMDGLSLLDHVCDTYPDTPIVLFTAVPDIQIATNAFRRGATDYLLKPFDRTELDRVVTRAIEHGLLRKQNARYRQSLDEVVNARTARLRTAMQDLERSYDNTLEAMGDALDLRDAETEGHSRRVTAYTVALARRMGVDGDALKVISRGAFLHDIGKIATPDAILLKPGPLDVHEVQIMRRHCAQGYEMVRKIPFLREASEIVLAHQESFDGTGYPRGLEGEQIPLGARIFAIADTLDAITSDRPYRKGASFAQAREEIARCAGKQFDPEVVSIFLDMPVERWIDLRAEIMQQTRDLSAGVLCRPATQQLPALPDQVRTDVSATPAS